VGSPSEGGLKADAARRKSDAQDVFKFAIVAVSVHMPLGTQRGIIQIASGARSDEDILAAAVEEDAAVILR
jgi:hypothetical protein